MPDRTRLLNELQVLLLPSPGSQDVVVKLRVNSGAAFDLAGKAGTMALLGDLLFPDPNTREYFTDEMQGRLAVSTDYDSITITMQGRTREFERIIEILRNAVVTTPLTPDNVQKAREGRTKIVKDTAILPATVADRAIAARLFGDFPYGRPYGGTVESLERIDRADVMLARDRFLNPNNSTLVIVGDLQPSRARRVLRQLMGTWRKSEAIVPATFKQPALPDPRPLLVHAPSDQSVEVRLAVRGVSRSDPDSAAASLLASVARQRWEKMMPDLARSPIFVRHDAFVLPGMFLMGATVENLLAGKALSAAREVLRSLASSPATPAELDYARNEVISALSKLRSKPDGVAEAWLDIEGYKLPAIEEQARAMSAISSEDLRRMAGRLVDERGVASVVVGNSELVKTQLEQIGKVEVMGEMQPKANASPESKSTPNAAKPPIKSSSKPD
ncbi:MAG TPA: insulinase family protein [Pyrinomonadaceae bacterium]|nr:insulinase family protein [Pyrinomonadaceae bacterium]